MPSKAVFGRTVANCDGQHVAEELAARATRHPEGDVDVSAVGFIHLNDLQNCPVASSPVSAAS